MRYPITFSRRFAGQASSALTRNYLVARRRFQRLDRARQYALLGLAGVGVLVLGAALVYLAMPETSAPASASHAHSTSPTTSNVAYTGPTIAGQYTVSVDARGDKMLFDLHQYGPDLTGSYTNITCGASGPQLATGLITGHVLADGDLSLTFSAPDQPHSATIVFHLATGASGLDLAWRDAAGQAKLQHWSPASTAIIAATTANACGK